MCRLCNSTHLCIQDEIYVVHFRDLCYGQDEMFNQVLTDYNNGKVTFVTRLCIVIRALVHVWEAVIYVMIFNHIWQHDLSKLIFCCL